MMAQFGQLGLGDVDGKNIPTLVHYLRGQHIIDIAAGANHSLAISRTRCIVLSDHSQRRDQFIPSDKVKTTRRY